MHILVTNDDGIDAPGIAALTRALEPLGTVWVVAPATEQSAQSHALTLHHPLRVRSKGERRWSVSGTPADSVYVALHQLLPHPPDLLVSGINRGANLGTDVFYSGTVAAAMEGCLHDIPSIAVSLAIDLGRREKHWATAEAMAQRVARRALEKPMAPGRMWNLNVPDLPLEQVKGLKATALGRRRYAALVEARQDPRGGRYYWIGGSHEHFDPVEGTDGPALEEGWATLTPLFPEWTMHSALPSLQEFTDE